MQHRGRIVDEVFGELRWLREPRRRIAVRGDLVPDADLVRSGTEAGSAWIPVGTRRGDLLSMTLDGESVDLRPGPGRMSRRSYRIAASTTGGPLLFTPSSPSTSRLVRGAQYRGDNELGVFEHHTDGAVHCTWSSPVRALGMTVDAPTARPADAALGYALALGFGTGAQLLLPAVVSALGRMIPG